MVDFFVLTLMSFEKFCHLFVAKLVHEYLHSSFAEAFFIEKFEILPSFCG